MVLKIKKSAFSQARPDDRGRITLGSKLTENVSKFDIYLDEETGDILLRPFREMPAKEAWLFKNQLAQKLVFKGIDQAKTRNLHEINLSNSNWIDEVEDEE